MRDSEKARLAEKDGKFLQEIADWMHAYNFEVCACGRDGELEYKKITEIAVQGIKILSNYIELPGG